MIKYNFNVDCVYIVQDVYDLGGQKNSQGLPLTEKVMPPDKKKFHQDFCYPSIHLSVIHLPTYLEIYITYIPIQYKVKKDWLAHWSVSNFTYFL